MVNCKGISGAEVLREEVLMKESPWSGDIDYLKVNRSKVMTGDVHQTPTMSSKLWYLFALGHVFGDCLCLESFSHLCIDDVSVYHIPQLKKNTWTGPLLYK